jgi:DNA-binding NtrC family response regulator
MPGKKIHANELARLLREADEPIYALDEDRTIVFLNRACEEWLGMPSERLIGVQANYHSPADANSPEAVAAGLCPPPEVVAGKIFSAVVHHVSPAPSGEDASVEKRRRAKFVPFGSTLDIRGILVILETEDCLPDFADSQAALSGDPSREELRAAIRRFRREAAGKFSADHLVGVSPAMQLARRQVEAAAASGCNACIAGPTGSGRQHLASVLHYASGGQKPDDAFDPGGIISLDCSALPSDLILSTLAASARSNAASEDYEANGPMSILLHRVDELTIEQQSEIAGLLLKKNFPRRLICTTTLPFSELVLRGKFRSDLAASLGTMTIVLPPLAERREDLPLLAQIVLEDCNRRSSKQVGGFTPEALDRLDAYNWPGNMDELVSVVAAAHKNAQGPEIKPEELPPQIHLAAQAAAHPRRAEEPIRLDEFLERVERELIRRAMAKAKGNKTKAARLLGLTRPRLYRRMVQLGLEEA